MRPAPAILLLSILTAAPALADDLADLRKRHKTAFRGLRLEPPSRIGKRLDPLLPKGIVTESGPFDAVIAAELEPFATQLREREEVLRALGGVGSPDAARLIGEALEALAKESEELLDRIADVEKQYADVYDRGFMESSEKARETRKRSAVLIPVYRTLLRRAEALAGAAAESLARMQEEQARGWLLAAVRQDPRSAVRAVAADALARAGGADAQAALRDALRSDRDHLVRMRALGALLAFKVVEVRDAIVAALADRAWNVRALAIQACVRAELIEAAGALIQALELEDGRLCKDLDDALSRLGKAQFFGDVQQWKAWWNDNRERIGKEAAERAASGAYDRALGPPRTWSRDDASDAGDEQLRERETSAFYGIPTVSKRVLFVVDISKSMESRAEATPAARPREKTRYPAPASGTKIDIARWQLHRAVEDLPSDAQFDIVVYSESYALWSDGMEIAKKSAKSKAHRFVGQLRENGVTNICDPLDKAFELAGLVPLLDSGKRAELAVDTIYLLSDGDPNRGRLAQLDRLFEELLARNPPGLFVIHAVGIGEAAGSSFLQELARAHGGRYVGYR